MCPPAAPASARARTAAYGPDGDGALDLTIVNGTARPAFRGRGDGRFDSSASVARVVLAPAPPKRRISTRRTHGRRGRNVDADSVSILLGRGDGTFAPARTLAIGRFPRGVAVLDADGDGDVDLAVAQAHSSNVAILLNDGAGQLAPPVALEGGVNAEWGLAAADFTGDGRLDLVVGGQDHQVAVLRNDGDGRFTPLTPADAGGEVWMITTGDVNGDGLADVATANSSGDNGAILGRRPRRPATGRALQRRAFTIASDLC